MAPGADITKCYICRDRRRTADIDASATPTEHHGEETLKQTLLRALSHGHVEDIAHTGKEEGEEARLTSGVCVVSLSSGFDGGLEAVSDRVAGDEVVICRRCTCLLKVFEHHEKMAARKAEEIRRFLMRRLEVEEEDTGEPSNPHMALESAKKTMARKHGERQGILAAFRAFRRTGIKDMRGRKRKKVSVSSESSNDGKGDDDDGSDSTEMVIKEDDVKMEEETQQQEVASTRHSKRIQCRKEDGLVKRWGDTMHDDEDDSSELEDDSDEFDDLPDASSKDKSYTRRGKGRKPTQAVRSSSLVVTGDDEMGFKFQCPFCFRYYTPMSSRIHNCTSYKNQLRCRECKIFFTAYMRLEKHLEVIHLRHNQLSCPEAGCNFTCIAEPTLTIHKHFHVLESFTGKSEKGTKEVKTAESDQEMKVKSIQDDATAESNEQCVESTPEMADRVSFLIDENSFLPDSPPLNITTDRASRDSGDPCKVVRFQVGEKTPEKAESASCKIEVSTPSPEKSEQKSPKSSSVLQCPVCDLTLMSTRSYHEHMQNIHGLKAMSKSMAESILSREPHKGQAAESLLRIVKHIGVKKNSNVNMRVMH